MATTASLGLQARGSRRIGGDRIGQRLARAVGLSERHARAHQHHPAIDIRRTCAELLLETGDHALGHLPLFARGNGRSGSDLRGSGPRNGARRRQPFASRYACASASGLHPFDIRVDRDAVDPPDLFDGAYEVFLPWGTRRRIAQQRQPFVECRAMVAIEVALDREEVSGPRIVRIDLDGPFEGGKRFGGQWVPFAVHDQRLPQRRPQYGLTRIDFRSLAIGRSRSAIFALFETQEAQFLPSGAIIGRFGHTFFEPVERRPQFGVVC